MIFYLLLFCLLSNSMFLSVSSESTKDCPIDPPNFNISKKIICYYQGNLDQFLPDVQHLDPRNLPDECDAICYASIEINKESVINVDGNNLNSKYVLAILDSVTALNKPVIVSVERREYYSGWSAVLTKDGNAEDTQVLCDFAKQHNITGYELFTYVPSDDEDVDKNITINMIPYIKQLKKMCPFLIISLLIPAIPECLSNKDLYNFKELNKVVTFYSIGTSELNECDPELYNGETPITKSAPGINYLYGLEEVIENLKNTEICFNKLSLEIPIMPTEIVNNTYPPYSQMCSEGKFDNSTWCVQNSQNYYDKGQFFRNQSIGVKVIGMDWDDYLNSCKCQSAFNGFYNVLAGYTDSELSGVKLNYSPKLFTLNNKKIIFYLLLFCLLSNSMFLSVSSDSTAYMSKSVICYYNGLRSNCDSSYDDLDPKMIPDGCDYILFVTFSINQSSIIHVNDELLKRTLYLNIPIILPVTRQENYSGWTALLSEDGNENDAKVLCDFAKTNNIKGYIFYNTEPGAEEVVINVKETAICFEKLVFVIPVFTVNNTEESYPAYTKMCERKTDKESIKYSCIQTSQNYYDKGNISMIYSLELQSQVWIGMIMETLVNVNQRLMDFTIYLLATGVVR
ncbi:hypothetical protein AGLY_018062 [Aphis glycines]|uniref:GH18 domain-containing protein n=1 Tax=Aphis glycines TaxID=307491 RepID=A0A6G0ST34_APHGL|nr:hypothetical protein AGLY_018062 [Aphis glycines]